MELQEYRDSLIDRAASAFSRDELDEASFEAFVARVSAASDPAELDQAAARLAPLGPAGGRSSAPASVSAAEPRSISISMSSWKQRGEWADERAYRLDGKMSNFKLDFRAYADDPDFRISLDVDLSMSNLKLIVPPDWRVDVDLSRNSASSVKDRGPVGARGPNRVVVRGSASMSNIKVLRRSADGLFLAFLFGGRR